MTIDHTKPEMYRLRNGCEVVRIIPTPEFNRAASAMLVIWRSHSGSVEADYYRENGRYGKSDVSCGLDLIPHDPVLYYANAYANSCVFGRRTWPEIMDAELTHTGRIIARIAFHASGKVRQIPLDWTEDKEPTP